ncbi:MAG: DUF748 domain-containing protein [Chthoniobacterales bacterium]|nr:DUF748 domain-containing protein [Chthoniobacterales bacterium]
MEPTDSNPSLSASRKGGGNDNRKSRRRLVRWVLWLLLVGIVLGIAFRLALPTLLQRGVAWGSRHYLGLPARVGAVHLSLWEGRAVFEDVGVAPLPDEVSPKAAAWHLPPLDAESAALHFGRITVAWSWSELFHKKVQVRELAVESPALRVMREADRMIDPLRHARPLAQPASKAAPKDGTSFPWPIEIQHFMASAFDIRILDAPTQKNLLEFSLESFGLDDISVRGADLGFGTMVVRGPVLRVWRDLLLTDPAFLGTSNSEPMAYRIRQIHIERAKFTWITKEGPLDVQMTLKTSGISAEQGARFPLDLTLEIGSGKVNLAGEGGILPPFFKGRLTWEGLSFPPLLLAAHPGLAAWLESADSSGDLNLSVNMGSASEAPGILVSGRTALDALRITNPDGSGESVGWERLETVIQEIFVPFVEEGKPFPVIRCRFDRIVLSSPRVRYTHPSPSLQTLLGQPSENSKGSAGKAGVPVDLRVDEFELKDGGIVAKDATVGATADIRDLEIALRGLRFPASTFDALALRASLPSAARLSIKGNLASGQVGHFVIGVEELDLPTWNPYAKPAGVSLDAGSVTLQTKLGLQGAVIQADSDIVLNMLDVSLRDPDLFSRQFGLPLDLALALLRDPAGNIRLTIPIRMDEKGSTVSMGAVIASALRAALIGAISSPLKLLGGAFGAIPTKGKSQAVAPTGGTPFAIAPIKCAAGNVEPEAVDRLDGFMKLLAERPNMGLVLRGRTSADDRPILATQLLIERVQSGKGLPEVSDAGFLARRRIQHYLAKRGKGAEATLEDKDRPLFDRYVAATEIPADRLDALANQRAERVRALLVARKIAPSRLTIGKPETGGEAGVGISFQATPHRSAPPGGKASANAQGREFGR